MQRNIKNPSHAKRKEGNSEIAFAFLHHFICYLVMESNREWYSGQAP
jgi:hypothetical protein